MSNLPVIRIGTRKSPLAQAQAILVAEKLKAAWPGLQTELVPISTQGDRVLDRPLSEIGGKGLFTKEIEDLLYSGGIQIAVHSMKDMPTVLPDGLVISCMLEREDPRDVLLGEGITSLASLPKGAKIGTSSLRRMALLKVARPDIEILPLRGNVQTRMNKLKEGPMQATLLAKAGLNRLGMYDVAGVTLSTEEFLPAIAQGAIGVECREDNVKIRELLAALSHVPTETAVNCERAFLKVLDGSCRTPIAGYAHIDKGALHFKGIIARPDGTAWHDVEVSGAVADALTLGEQAGKTLAAKAGTGFLD